MATYPYTVVPGNLKKFLTSIQSNGVPPKVTQKVLAAQGYKSSNDRTILTVLRELDFVTGDGAPTLRWQAYRDKQKSAVVLGKAIQETYADLFSLYPDAYRKDDEALRNFFRAHTTVGERTLSAIVGTFKVLCELASFVEPLDEESHEPQVVVGDSGSNGSHKVPPAPLRATIAPGVGRSGENPLAININIQLQLPATQDADVYSKLFQALRSHLLES